MRKTLLLGLSLGSLVACGDGDGKSSCEQACERVAASGCPGVEPPATCVAGCNQLLELDPACAAEANAYVACIAGTTFTCDVDGDPDPVGCDAEIAALEACWGGPASLPVE